MPGFSDPAIDSAIYTGFGDVTRQVVSGKTLKPMKAVSVTAADYAYQKLLKTQLEVLGASMTGESQVSSAVMEILGTALGLTLFDRMGLIKKSSAQVEGASGNAKDASFMNVLTLSSIDVVVGKGLKYGMSGIYGKSLGDGSSQ